ncbi:MAG: hypothetical protein KF799_02920 [Bdellovibrionales bacterium]|nr:hypothetical protein [Bdellovibrionales bacterium]
MSRSGTPYVVLIVLALVSFSPALTGGFLSWDDTQHILLNPWLRAGDLSHFWKETYYSLYIPVTYSIWTLLYKISPQPLTFHIFNLLLHMANAVMVFILARRLFPQNSRWGAVLAAAIFTVHPLQVETVAWISGGRDLLAAFFALAACVVAIRSVPQPKIPWARSSLAILFFALSLLAKPVFVLLPLGLAWFQFWRRGLPFIRRPVLVVWTALSVMASLLALWMQGPSDRLLTLPMWQRVLVAVDSIGFYLSKVLLPWPLSADYGRSPEGVIKDLQFVPNLFLVAAFALFAVWLHRRCGSSVRGLAGFFVLLILPVLGFVPFAAQLVSTVFDRYMYLPMFVLALFACCVAGDRRVRYGLIAVLVLWSSMSFMRSQVWSDNGRLAQDMIDKNPRSYDGLNNLALVEIEAHNWAQAGRLLREATFLRPDSAVAWSNLGYVYWSSQDLVPILSDIVPRLQSKNFVASNNREPQALGLMYRMSARAHASLRDNAKAMNLYCDAVKYDPLDVDLRKEMTTYSTQHFPGQTCQD